MPKQSGPITLSGKAISCLNHLTHGAASDSLFIAGEDPAEFDALLKDGFETHSPATEDDARLIGDFARARWLLTRRQLIHSTWEFELHRRISDPTQWTAEDMHKLNLFDRYQTQAERAFKRSLDNVRTIRQAAFNEQRRLDLLDLQRQRFQLQRERFEFTKEKQARIVAKQEARAAAKQQQAEHSNKKAQHQPNNPAEPTPPSSHLQTTPRAATANAPN